MWEPLPLSPRTTGVMAAAWTAVYQAETTALWRWVLVLTRSLMDGSPRRSDSVTVSPRAARASRAGLRAVMWRPARYWAAAR